MRYLSMKLPGSSLDISRIVLGTDYFGATVPEETAFRLMDIFADAGGNCVDTARMYASWLPDGAGASERTIGNWLKSRGNRNHIIISTKGGHPRLDQMSTGRLSREEIESDLDESLQTLGVDVIDLYWLHRDDVTRPVEDIMETLSSLINKGKIRAIGCSNWRADRVAEANRAAQTNGFVPFSASQIQWSLATSTPKAHDDPTIVCMDEQEYGWYLKESFPVFAFSSQAKGFFARAAAKGLDAVNQKAYTRFSTPENIERLERVKKYAADNSLTISAVTLGYIMSNQVPAAAIVGCKSEEQLLDSLTAADVELSQTVTDWLFGVV